MLFSGQGELPFLVKVLDLKTPERRLAGGGRDEPGRETGRVLKGRLVGLQKRC